MRGLILSRIVPPIVAIPKEGAEEEAGHLSNQGLNVIMTINLDLFLPLDNLRKMTDDHHEGRLEISFKFPWQDSLENHKRTMEQIADFKLMDNYKSCPVDQFVDPLTIPDLIL